MTYELAYKRFNLNSHIKKLADLDWLEMVTENGKECNAIEKISIPRKAENKTDIEYLQQKYLSNLKGLGFFLGQGIKPYGVDEDTFQSFKPLIESLVSKGQMKEEILTVFDTASQ